MASTIIRPLSSTSASFLRTAACRTTTRTLLQQPQFHFQKRIIPSFLSSSSFSTSTSLFSGVKKFTTDHEYLHLSTPTSTTATIGITTHAASALGDIVFIELPGVGTALTAGDALGTVESVKSASEIISPINGVVVEVNEKLADKPAELNVDTAEDVGEDGGWICKVQVEEGVDVGEGLMSEEEYEAFKRGEGH